MCVSDVGQVTAVRDGQASVRIGERMRQASVALHPAVAPGDWVVVGAGLIFDLITEAEARELESFQREMAAALEASLEDGHEPIERAVRRDRA